MKTPPWAILLIIASLLGFGSAVWMYIQRNEALMIAEEAEAKTINTINELRSAYSNLMDNKIKLKTASDQANHASSDLQKLKSQISSMRKSIKSLTKERNRLQKNLADAKQQKANLGDELAFTKVEASQLKAEIISLKAELTPHKIP